jgi:hypothetical protein
LLIFIVSSIKQLIKKRERINERLKYLTNGYKPILRYIVDDERSKKNNNNNNHFARNNLADSFEAYRDVPHQGQ